MSADAKPTASDAMGPERIAEMRARCEAATPGPWMCWNAYPCAGGSHPPGPTCVHVSRVGPAEVDHSMGLVADGGHADINGSQADLAFIAHARQDVPDLLAEVDRQAEEIARLREESERNWPAVARRTNNMLAQNAALLAERDALRQRVAALEGRLADREWQGRLMHESWMETKLAQGFHRPPPSRTGEPPCDKCHADLVPWDDLPERQKDINRHAFDKVTAALLADAERRGA